MNTQRSELKEGPCNAQGLRKKKRLAQKQRNKEQTVEVPSICSHELLSALHVRFPSSCKMGRKTINTNSFWATTTLDPLQPLISFVLGHLTWLPEITSDRMVVHTDRRGNAQLGSCISAPQRERTSTRHPFFRVPRCRPIKPPPHNLCPYDGQTPSAATLFT